MAVTIKDISRQAAVSIATVSMVLNGDYSKVSEDTRDRILKVADELNYRPNLGAFRAIREHKLKVPRIFPWLGLTMYTFPQPWSKLTTVKQPANKIGVYATKMLLDQIEKRITADKVNCFKPSLVERDTVSFRV